jgi:sulfonate transport system substrate-binding protein
LLNGGPLDPASITGRIARECVDAAQRLEVAMTKPFKTRLSRRHVVLAGLAVGMLPASTAFAADKPKEINIDWATYNPVSMYLKDHGLMEKEFAKDGISIRWVQTLGSNKALEFLNAGSIDFGSSAGAAALVSKINGNPIKSIYVYSKPEWTALVTRKDSNITKITDLKGRSVAVTRGTDPHIFLVRALLSVGMTEHDIREVLLQHPDGKTALIRGDVDAWAGLDPMMAQAEIEDGARLFYRNADANTYGILSTRIEFLRDHLDLVKRVLAVYETARKYCLAHPQDMEASFIAATKLPKAVVEKQLNERTDITNGRIGAAQRDSILQAGFALQKAGVIPANVDVKKVLDDLIDDRYVTASN